MQLPEVKDVVSFAGFDIISSALRTNSGVAFVTLEDWAEREGEGQKAADIANKIMGIGFGMPEAFVIAFTPPPIQGLSTTGGVEGYIQARGGRTPAEIKAMADQFTQAANARPELQNVRVTWIQAFPVTRPTWIGKRPRLPGFRLTRSSPPCRAPSVAFT